MRDEETIAASVSDFLCLRQVIAALALTSRKGSDRLALVEYKLKMLLLPSVLGPYYRTEFGGHILYFIRFRCLILEPNL